MYILCCVHTILCLVNVWGLFQFDCIDFETCSHISHLIRKILDAIAWPTIAELLVVLLSKRILVCKNTAVEWSCPVQFHWQDGRIDYGEFATMMRKGNAGFGGRTMIRGNLNISLAEAFGVNGEEDSENNWLKPNLCIFFGFCINFLLNGSKLKISQILTVIYYSLLIYSFYGLPAHICILWMMNFSNCSSMGVLIDLHILRDNIIRNAIHIIMFC